MCSNLQWGFVEWTAIENWKRATIQGIALVQTDFSINIAKVFSEPKYVQCPRAKAKNLKSI